MFRSFARPSLLSSRLSSSLPLLFCPRPLRFHFPLSSCLHPFILASLPSTSLRPSVATSLPSSLSMSLPFSRLCLSPSLRHLIPSTLSAFLPRPCPPFSLPTLNKLTTDISLAYCISLWCDFVLFWFFLRGQLPLFDFPFSET